MFKKISILLIISTLLFSMGILPSKFSNTANAQTENEPIIIEDRSGPRKPSLQNTGFGIGGGSTSSSTYMKNNSSSTNAVQWTNHGFKHFPSKNTSWSSVVKSTKNGPAKYKHNTNVEALERGVWATGQPVNNGKSWKVERFSEVIGASNGVETNYVRVEYSAGTIHGHPITKAEYIRLTK